MCEKDAVSPEELLGPNFGLRAQICACGAIQIQLGFVSLRFSREGFDRVLGFFRDVEARLRAREAKPVEPPAPKEAPLLPQAKA